MGLGASVEKLHYLEAHTDFLMAVVGELGFAGVMLVISLFAIIVYRGFDIGRQAIAMERTFAGLVAWRGHVVRRSGLGRLSAVKPDVVLGMGGWRGFPGGVIACVRARRVVHEQNAVAGTANKWRGRAACSAVSLRARRWSHEQNAVAGTANKWLARTSRRVLSGFPGVLPKGEALAIRCAPTCARCPIRRNAMARAPAHCACWSGGAWARRR